MAEILKEAPEVRSENIQKISTTLNLLDEIKYPTIKGIMQNDFERVKLINYIQTQKSGLHITENEITAFCDSVEQNGGMEWADAD